MCTTNGLWGYVFAGGLILLGQIYQLPLLVVAPAAAIVIWNLFKILVGAGIDRALTRAKGHLKSNVLTTGTMQWTDTMKSRQRGVPATEACC